MRITVVEVNPINAFPPVQTLIKVLLTKGHSVKLISRNISFLPEWIQTSPQFTAFEIPNFNSMHDFLCGRIIRRYRFNNAVVNKVQEFMNDSDILWTCSLNSIRVLRKEALKHKHVFQLMELVHHGKMTKLNIPYRLDTIARHAHKVVVPEVNRAYISKVWWELEEVPTVLPNKPFDLCVDEIPDAVRQKLDIITAETRKIVLYLGGIYSDRDLVTIASAIANNPDYVLYIVGKAFTQQGEQILKELQSKYGTVYLGGFNPPYHLAFIKYAHIGILPYKPVKSSDSSELNALYCAPNKIYEYAGFGVPMIGSDVLGLRLPFERWNMGCCYCDDSQKSIIDAIKIVEKSYDIMKQNCISFYNDTNIEQIIDSIICG